MEQYDPISKVILYSPIRTKSPLGGGKPAKSDRAEHKNDGVGNGGVTSPSFFTLVPIFERQDFARSL